MGKIINLTGQRFGRVKVLEETEKRTKQGAIIWKCKCDCGNISYVSSRHLKQGNKKSCGCLRIKNLTDQRFGRLKVLEETDKRTKSNGNVVWKCKCDCGNISYVSSRHLKQGDTKSCGCFNKEKARKQKNGMVLPSEAYQVHRNKRLSKYLTDSYVRRRIKYSKHGKNIEIEPSLIEMKRQQLKLMRELRKQKKEFKK